jgi:predicted MFS family arabinose efflux permease/quinol monooxygenase YgiN
MTPPISGNELPTAWSPLRNPLFRALWIATLVSNIGTWMQNVGAAWLMTSLAPSPVMVSLVQSAMGLPVFLLALPAGALADVMDRRRLLLFTQGWMLIAAAGLGLLTFIGVTTPWLLLAFTFLIGVGAVLTMPAWQAIVPELVPRPELPSAVSLNSAGFNVARAVGPALGGLTVAAAGAWAAFLLNAVTFLSVLVVLYRWHRPPRESVLPTERVIGAIRVGIRYVRHAPAVHAVLVRIGVFVIPSSALWALLPFVARFELKHGSTGYGLLLGCLGVGAVMGAAILPDFRRRVSTDFLVGGATILFSAVTVTLAYVRSPAVLFSAMVVGGFAWMALISTLNVAVQMAAPSWVRARVLAVYLLVLQGGMTVGSALWGVVASHAGVTTGLLFAALGLLVGLAAALRYHLIAGEGFDLTPSLHWPEPSLSMVNETDLDRRPVLVTIEYRIDPAQSGEFLEAMNKVRPVRRRDGAIRWDLFRDASDPGRYVESFVAESWVEHLRQHERVTMADRVVEEEVRTFHIGSEPPLVSHFIAEPLPEKKVRGGSHGQEVPKNR